MEPLRPLLLSLALLLAAAAARAGDPLVAAAGDVACDPADPGYQGGSGTATTCRMKDTSDLLVGAGLDAVLLLGDNQYEDGALLKYDASYDPTWGRVKAITRPIPGNHEYNTAGAAGYFAYFGAAAGGPGASYYSFDLGGWHLVALDSNCGAVGGCGAGSPEERWLAADLAAHAGVCTLAYWHHPRFSSGQHGDDATFVPFWADLHAAGADLVLNGHDHDYERFAPQDEKGAADPLGGVREFVVGTGGKNHTAFATLRAQSEARSADTFGVLALTLHPGRYDWRFLPAAGGTFEDSGSGVCHRAGPAAFHTLPPCRAVDTRAPAGPLGGPALAANAERTFPLAGACGIPPTALAVAANLTVVSPAAAGDLRLFPAGSALPTASAINFTPGRTRANQAIAALGAGGAVTVRCDMPAGTAGGAHLLIDVSGYFE